MKTFSNKTKKSLRSAGETAIAVTVACLVLAFVVWAVYEYYSQCRDDGYSVTACRMMMGGNRVVILEDNR